MVAVVVRTHPSHARPLTQELVGGWLGITQAQLSRIENGTPLKDLDKLIRHARILGIPADLLWFKLPASSVTPAGSARTSTAEPAQDPRELARWITGRSRGSRVSPAVEFDEAQHVAAALRDARRYLDGPVVEFFRQRLARCKADDGDFGPAKALPLVVGILGAIRQRARDVPCGVRTSLLAVAADGAEFAGWLYRDLRNPQAAVYWYDRAMEWAQEANDLALQGYVLMKKSQMAYDAHDVLRVATLAQAANCGPWRLPARVRAEVLQQESLGLAMVGEPVSTIERRLEQAHALLTGTAPDESQPLGAYFNESTFLLRSACCYTEAGKPKRAVRIFGDVIGSGTLPRRDVGLFGARRATALVFSGEPDEAARIALESLASARATGSERTRKVVTEVLRALEPWRDRPGARALRDALASE